MAFNGIHKAPPIEPTEFGLFAFAKPASGGETDSDERWVRGFSQEYDTRPSYVRNWDETSSTSHEVSSDPNAPLYQELKPIFIEVEDDRSTFSVTGEDRFDRVLKQLEGVSQKALEQELWNGDIAFAEDLSNTYLTSLDATVIDGGVAFAPTRALALLEYRAGAMSPAGEHGVIHLTRDTFIAMTSGGGAFMRDDDKEFVQTTNRTPVIIGSGYTGDGPRAEIATIAVASNVATVVTATPHYLVTGETARIRTAVGGTAFDGDFTATVTNATTFTVPVTTSNQSPTATDGSVQMKGTSTKKWAYVTGHVETFLGKSTVVNDTLAQGYNVSGNQNDLKIKATRPAIAHFDPSIHLAIKVDLTV
jgi:hypothetical protein